MYKKDKFDIEGMHCPSCAYRLQKHLKKINGIKDANANLASGSLSIEYDPDLIPLDILTKEVKQMGYNLIPPPPSTNLRRFYERRKKRSQLRLRSQGIQLTYAVIFLIPLFFAAVAPFLPRLAFFTDTTAEWAVLQILLSTPILIVGWRILISGWRRIFRFKPNIDSLVAISVTASLGYSLYSGYFLIWGNKSPDQYPVYFLPACAIIVMIMLGRYLEARMTNKTRQSLRQLTELLPQTAIRTDKDGIEEVVNIDDLNTGDWVKILPGTHIPVDGIVIKGVSVIDESAFSASKSPVQRSVEDKVLAGMFNIEATMIVEISKKGDDTTLAGIIRIIEEGENSRPSISHFADRISFWVIQGILAIAFLAAGLWGILSNNYPFAFSIFISILMIACPVALGLAIPVSVLIATRKASSLGIIIRRISAFESVCEASCFVFNMNGTLTKGKPVVTDIITPGEYSPEQLLELTASAESQTDHPLADAIINEAKKRNITLSKPDPVRELPGQGLEAVINDIRVDIGNRKLMELIQVDTENLEHYAGICRELSDQGKSPVIIAIEGILQGIIAVEDKPRAEAREIIEKLHQKQIKVVLLTGEHWSTAKHIAQEVGIQEVFAEVQPINRARLIRKLQHEGQVVIMVGDGFNDAGALAQANAGIVIGSADDIASDAADIILLNKDLRLLLKVQRLAHSTLRNIKENLFFAFLYNLLTVPVAAGFMYLFDIQFRLNPILAIVVMFLGSLSVLLNAIRLRRFK